MSFYSIQEDGTIEDLDGNIVFFSVESFKDRICEGNDCFLCGAKREKTVFNDEHVIPKWILRKYKLFDVSITLPNDVKIRYDKYVIPCCTECNSWLGEEVEEDICRAVDGGLAGVNAFVRDVGPLKVFLWLSLIFLKTHLKDSLLRKHLDARKGLETIGSDYEWGLLHHIHCMVRALKTGAVIEPRCMGSLMILPAKQAEHYTDYDYRDIYGANTILLQLGEVAFLAVLDDSCAALNLFSNQMKRITGPLSPIQLREVISHLAFLNIKLKYRPTFSTKVNPSECRVYIAAHIPDSLELEEYTAEEFGEYLYSNVSQINIPELLDNMENIKLGYYHFLFDENGKFIENSMDILDESKQRH